MKSEHDYNSTDLTFFTNEPGATLLDRFKSTLGNATAFDVLVGYFYTSGFHAIYKSLEETDKIRILIGISTNRQTADYIEQAAQQRQQSLQFSSAEVKKQFSDKVISEFENSNDNNQVEEGVVKFIEWLKSGKLEIKAYPSENIHAKVYIMTAKEGSWDKGRVITGSSNFTKAGLEDNLEFNVELKNRSDYEFAQKKFNDLWEDAVDVTDKYVDTIQTKTWLNDNILPYELYLKFLYEYFKDEISKSYEDFFKYTPPEFKKLEYQELAVLNAKKILDVYGGVFLSDVVGLGKTYMGAMLANQLDGRHLVIAPPALLDKNNPGSWRNVFTDFRVAADFESLGQLDRLIKLGTDKYKNIFIDEAHRFRTETNETYEKLAEICRGKRIILVTATPYNNSPKDILSQIKLFQPARKSSIPNLADLERFFSKLDKKLKGLDRQKDRGEFIKITKDNAKEIRDKILKYLMVRRTRNEIQTFFGKDLKSQGLKFPEVAEPEAVFYELNPKEDRVFNQTMEFIIKDFNYARYTPLLYLQDKLSQPESVGQKNMGKFMKILLVKRLESSFYAFRNSIGRFINSYEIFIKEFERGKVYFSKKHANKIFELLENDNDDAIQKLIDSDKATVLPSEAFNKKFIGDLKSDLNVLNSINNIWEDINRDPKLLKFIDILKSNRILKKTEPLPPGRR